MAEEPSGERLRKAQQVVFGAAARVAEEAAAQDVGEAVVLLHVIVNAAVGQREVARGIGWRVRHDLRVRHISGAAWT